MNEIQNAIDELVKTVKNSADKNVVACKIFISFGDLEIKFIKKDPAALKTNNISMRNLRGEWVI